MSKSSDTKKMSNHRNFIYHFTNWGKRDLIGFYLIIAIPDSYGILESFAKNYHFNLTWFLVIIESNQLCLKKYIRCAPERFVHGNNESFFMMHKSFWSTLYFWIPLTDMLHGNKLIVLKGKENTAFIIESEVELWWVSLIWASKS